MKLKQKVYNFYKIESNSDSNELVSQISVILKEGNSHNSHKFSKASWQWQYKNLPLHKSLIYVASDNENRIVGYYHVPSYTGIFNDEEKIFAVIQDVAISISERGNGLFLKLANFANKDIDNNNIDLVYTFPNDKSIHTFLKYNDYKKLLGYKTYILPIDRIKLVKSKIRNPIAVFAASSLLSIYSFLSFKTNLKIDDLVTHGVITEDISTFYEKFSSNYIVHLKRSHNYLTWRYNFKPNESYKVISIYKNDTIIASGIFKVDTILGTDALLLMDFAFEKETDLLNLIHVVKMNSFQIFEMKLAFIFTSFNCEDLLKKRLGGFIKIPSRFNPRVLNMLVRNISIKDENNLLNSKNWLTTLGDWDIF